MPTDIYLGGLASLILVAIIIVSLTTSKRNEYSGRRDGYQRGSDNGPKSKSGR